MSAALAELAVWVHRRAQAKRGRESVFVFALGAAVLGLIHLADRRAT